MTDLISALIFEFLVYIIPGIIILVFLVLWFNKQIPPLWIKNLINPKPIIYLIAFVLIIILGVLNHSITATVCRIRPVSQILKLNYNDKDKYNENTIRLIKRNINQIYNDTTLTSQNDFIYRYALNYIREKSTGGISRRIDRLSALSSFSLNIILPLILFTSLFIKKELVSKRFNKVSIFGIATIIILVTTFFLIIASRNYITAVKTEVYKAYLIISHNNQNIIK